MEIISQKALTVFFLSFVAFPSLAGKLSDLREEMHSGKCVKRLIVVIMMMVMNSEDRYYDNNR